MSAVFKNLQGLYFFSSRVVPTKSHSQQTMAASLLSIASQEGRRRDPPQRIRSSDGLAGFPREPEDYAFPGVLCNAAGVLFNTGASQGSTVVTTLSFEDADATSSLMHHNRGAQLQSVSSLSSNSFRTGRSGADPPENNFQARPSPPEKQTALSVDASTFVGSPVYYSSFKPSASPSLTLTGEARNPLQQSVVAQPSAPAIPAPTPATNQVPASTTASSTTTAPTPKEQTAPAPKPVVRRTVRQLQTSNAAPTALANTTVTHVETARAPKEGAKNPVQQTVVSQPTASTVPARAAATNQVPKMATATTTTAPPPRPQGKNGSKMRATSSSDYLKLSLKKPTADTKIGLCLETIAGRIYVKSVETGSPAADAGFCMGHCLYGIDAKTTFLKMLRDAVGVIVILVYDHISIIFDTKRGSVNFRSDEQPTLLSQVPPTAWQSVYEDVAERLSAALQTANKLDLEFRKVMGIGQMYSVAAASQNCNLVATNILTKSNALMNPHGILVQLVLEERPNGLAKEMGVPNATTMFPVGLSFSKLYVRAYESESM